MSVTFTKNATSVTLPDPAGAPELSRRKHQTAQRTQGGAVRIHDQGISTCEAELLFESLTDTEKSDLQDFFHTTVNGMMQTFAYTDENSVEYTARFLDPDIHFTKVAYNVHDITLKLELSAMPA